MELPHKVVDEYINKLERDGNSEEYIRGVLTGMSFVLEFYQTMVKLNARKSELIKKEHNVST